MIFQHTHAWITSPSPHTGQPKTQTSRLAAGYDVTSNRVLKNGRLHWQLGGEYAVQPARGRRAVARIRLTSIRTADVRTFTQDDAQREGFADVVGFLDVWRLMHDYGHRHDPIETLSQRPFDRYFALVLEFEVL
jgi:hypothetical protein